MSTNAKTQSRQPSATRTRGPAKKGERNTSMTSERIAADMAAFRKSGGKIEVLGNTQVFKSIGPAAAASKSTPATTKKKAAPAKKRA